MKIRTRKRRIDIRRVSSKVPLSFDCRRDLTRLKPITFLSERHVLDTLVKDAAPGAVVTSAEVMERLRQQAVAQIELDIATERLLPEKEICHRLRMSTDALSAAVKTKQIFAIKGPAGEYYYPAFFADSRKATRAALKKICAALGNIPASMKWDFFTAPLISLGGKNPVQAITRGKVGAVMDAAKALLEE